MPLPHPIRTRVPGAIWLLVSLLTLAGVFAGTARAQQIYYPFDFGTHDGNEWQVWGMNGSNIYPAAAMEYVGGYLHERWPLQTYSGFYCSSCAQYGIFEGNPVIDGRRVLATGSTLALPQNFAGDETRIIDIQWSATGYHWKIENSDGSVYSTFEGDAFYPVTDSLYDAFWEDFSGYGPNITRSWQSAVYGASGLSGGRGIATTPQKITNTSGLSVLESVSPGTSAINVSFSNYHPDGDALVGTLQIENISDTWVYLEQDVTALPNPVSGLTAPYLLGPEEVKQFSNFRIPRSFFLKLVATTPVGIDFTTTSDKRVALIGALIVDLMARGLLCFSLPPETFDTSLDTVTSLFGPILDNIVSTADDDSGDLIVAVKDGDVTEITKALTAMAAQSKQVENFLIDMTKGYTDSAGTFHAALASADHIHFVLQNVTEFFDLLDRVRLLTDLTAATHLAAPVSWYQIQVIQQVAETASVDSISPTHLTTAPLTTTQTLTIHGAGFSTATKLLFTYGTQSYASRPDRLVFVDDNTLQYSIAVGSGAGTWTVSAAGGTGSATFQVDADPATLHTITATSGAHGSISPTGSISVADGGTQTFIAAPADGTYEVDSWSVDGAVVPEVGPRFTLSGIQDSHTVLVSFRLKGAASGSGTDDYGDSSTTAAPLTSGSPLTGYISSATDVDWFKIAVASPGPVSFQLKVPRDKDYDLELYGPDGNYITGSYNGTGATESISFTAPSAGTYYVRVYGYPYGNGSFSTTETYNLSATLIQAGPGVLLKQTLPFSPITVPALGDDGRFYLSARIGGGNAGVVAFDPASFHLLWGPFTPTQCSGFPGAAVSVGQNGLIYGAGDANECGNGRLVALNPAGSMVWQDINGSPHPRHTPALDDASQTLFFGSTTIEAIDSTSSTRRWASDAGYYIGGQGIALDAASNLYIGTQSGAGGNTRILSFTPGGTVRWQRDFSTPQQDGPFIVGVPNQNLLLLYQLGANRLLAWNTGDGTDAWAAADLTNPVTDPNGDIYASAVTTNDIVALSPTGHERWRRTLSGTTRVAADFVDNAGLLYVRGDNTLFALNTTDGSIVWQFKADASLQFSAITGDGRLFLADSAATGYLLDLHLEYARSTWPVALLGNRRHTGKSGDLAAAALPVTTPTISWLGVASNDWSNPLNWNLGRVPGSSDSVTIPAGASVSFSDASAATISVPSGASLTWTGGETGAALTIASGATLNICGDALKTLSGSITNSGTINWSGKGGIQMNVDAVTDPQMLTNNAGGVVNLLSDTNLGTISFSGKRATFSNAGTLRKSGSTGTSAFVCPVTSTGTIDVQSGTIDFAFSCTQTAGALTLSGGALMFENSLALNGGSLSGNGIIQGDVNNAAGSVSPGGLQFGALIIKGNYVQGASGNLDIKLGSGGNDSLVVTGAATFGGALILQPQTSFNPPSGTGFAILSFASHTGDFSVVTGAMPGGGITLQEGLGATSLVFTSAGPQPLAITKQPAGLTAIVGDTVSLTVAATGAAPVRFQWRKNGSTLPGATGSSLVFSPAQLTDSGSYDVLIGDGINPDLASSVAVVAVISGPGASHAPANTGYSQGATVTINNSFVYAGTATALGWHVILPEGWSYISGAGSEGDHKPAAGTTSLLDWSWTAVPASPVVFSYTLRVPAIQAGSVTISAMATLGQNGQSTPILVKPDPLVISALTTHSADTDRDFKISLLELTRVIELFNTRNGTTRTGAYQIDPAGEDGFNPAPDRTVGAVAKLAGYHSADEDHDGKISLLELTRVIELFNYRTGTVRTGQYHFASAGEVSEDGFNPGP